MDSERKNNIKEFLDEHPELSSFLGTYLALMIFEKGIKIFRDVYFPPVKFPDKDVIEK